MITDIKDLFSNIFYDWGYSHTEQQINKDEDNSFWINKTYIYKKDEKYFLDYKTDQSEVRSDVFSKFKKFYSDYQDNHKMEKILNIMSDSWFTSYKNKPLRKFTKDSINLNNELLISISNNRVILNYKEEISELPESYINEIETIINLFK